MTGRAAVGSVVGGGAVLVACAVVAQVFPSTNPSAIRAKARIVGPRLTYAPLAHDDAKWRVVLQGVRSGDPVWLGVAAALEPALDTHPGEEMLGAVSNVLDRNPRNAIELLLPTYGPEIVCGTDTEGAALNRLDAERRISALASVPSSPGKAACLNVLRRIGKGDRAVEQGDEADER
jgi:hypothetical protein